MGSINICRAFYDKEDHIKQLISAQKLDMLFVQECDIKNVDPKNPPRIQDFQTICPKKMTKETTRILLLIKEDIKMTVREDLMSSDISSIWIETRSDKGTKTIIGSLYREFNDLSEDENSKSLSEQNERFQTFINQIEKASEERGTIICLGDLNLDSNKWDDTTYGRKTMSNKLKETLEKLNMTLLSYGDTFLRIDKDNKITKSAIDHAFSNDMKRIKEHEAISCGFTDHHAITLTLSTEKEKKDKHSKKTMARNLRAIRNNPQEYRRKLANIDWGKLETMEDVDDMTEFWTTEINKVFNEMAPLKEKSIRKGKKIGLSKETKEQMKIRDKLKQQILKGNNPEIEDIIKKYKAQRNLCNRLIKAEKNKLMYKRLADCGPPEIWRIVNEITKPKQANSKLTIRVKDRTIDNEKEVANEINTFFIEKVKGLIGRVDKTKQINPIEKIKEINPGGRTNEKGERLITPLVLQPVEESKVKKIIQELKPKTSCGKDGMSAELLKLGGEVLHVPLTRIINTSIATKKFPTFWKEAVVKPLWKNKGSKEEMQNYRPVALLCVPGMILERVVTEQIENHLEENNLMGECQFGFRRVRSTQAAVATLCCTAQRENQNKKAVGMIMYDLSAAFDTVEKKTLCSKMEYLALAQSTIDWIDSYLTKRLQRVKIGNDSSEIMEIPFGTPQGSRLSPLLFNILACDLNLYLTRGQLCNFADDTSNVCSADTMEEVKEKLTKDSDEMIKFTTSNNLVINCDKTAFICNKSNPKNPETITVGKDIITATQSTKLLGIEVAGDLTWTAHVEELKKKLRQRMGILRRLKYSLPPRALSQVAEAIFTSKIRYGLALYCRPRISENDQSNGTLKQITKYQNDVMRIITGKKCRDKVSIESLRKTTGTTSVNHLLCYHILIDMFNILKDTASATMKEMLTKKLGNSNITTRSTTQNKVTAPVNYGKKNDFAYYGPTLWNLLPEHIRNAETAEQIRNANCTGPEVTNSQQTNKAKMLTEQYVKRRLKNAFKAYIKIWINDNIPSD